MRQCNLFGFLLLIPSSPFPAGPKDTSYVSQSKRYVEGEDMAVNQGATQVESEEEEEGTEESRGDRFKTERTTIVSLKASNKSYGNIPDSLGMLCC